MKKPIMVAIMNFFVWGTGYLYLHRAWGFWLAFINFNIIYVAIMVDLSIIYNPLFFVFMLIPSLAFAWHGYEMAKKEEKPRKRK